MSQRREALKAQLEVVRKTLLEAGVREWTTENTNGSHVRVKFYRHGKPKILIFAASTDPHAIQNNRSTLRRLLYAD